MAKTKKAEAAPAIQELKNSVDVTFRFSKEFLLTGDEKSILTVSDSFMLAAVRKYRAKYGKNVN